MRALYISALFVPILASQSALAISANSVTAIQLSDTRKQPVAGTAPLSYRGAADRALMPNLAPDLTKIDISANSRTMFVALPEPSTWFSMIAGFTLVGAVVRKVRRDNNI